jgi:dTMP kinase
VAYALLVFVSLEGIDGSGKSTHALLLAETLRSEGRDVVATREPGGTHAGERIRDLLLGDADLTPWAEAALFAAARAQLVEEVIRPALEHGAVVVCDRFLDSSLAYQGLARELGLEAVLELNRIATRGLVPDRTFLLVLPVDEALRRSQGEPDRIEREGRAFLEKVANAYAQLAERFPERIVAVDAALPTEQVAEQIREELRAVA